jgi:hypothetical protein
MAKNYRELYEKDLGIKLAKGTASIHHMYGRKEGLLNSVKSLVALPGNLHQDYNDVISKFPRLMKNIIRKGNYNVIKEKNLRELRKCLDIYSAMNTWYAIKMYIKAYGLEAAKANLEFQDIDISSVYEG